jgi:hypothetical protein
MAPHMNYADLEGIKEGNAASNGFIEAISPDTDFVHKAELEDQLLRYCKFDSRSAEDIGNTLEANGFSMDSNRLYVDPRPRIARVTPRS